jgi:hypothetical protein
VSVTATTSSPRAPGVEPSLSGAICVPGRQVLQEILGPARFDLALAGLPPQMEAEYRGGCTLSWVPIRLLERVVDACGEQVGRSGLDLNDEVSRICVERSFRTIWRIFFRFTSDAALLSRTPVLYEKTYNTGRLEVAIPRSGESEMTLREWPRIPELALRALSVGMETTLRVAGREDVRIRWKRTEHGAVFTGRWR